MPRKNAATARKGASSQITGLVDSFSEFMGKVTERFDRMETELDELRNGRTAIEAAVEAPEVKLSVQDRRIANLKAQLAELEGDSDEEAPEANGTTVIPYDEELDRARLALSTSKRGDTKLANIAKIASAQGIPGLRKYLEGGVRYALGKVGDPEPTFAPIPGFAHHAYVSLLLARMQGQESGGGKRTITVTTKSQSRNPLRPSSVAEVKAGRGQGRIVLGGPGWKPRSLTDSEKVTLKGEILQQRKARGQSMNPNTVQTAYWRMVEKLEGRNPDRRRS